MCFLRSTVFAQPTALSLFTYFFFRRLVGSVSFTNDRETKTYGLIYR